MVSAECDSGWVYNSDVNRCFYFEFTDKRDASFASTYCKERQSNLATIPSKSVNDFLYNAYKGPQYRAVWIGLQRGSDCKKTKYKHAYTLMLLLWYTFPTHISDTHVWTLMHIELNLLF